MLYVHAIVIVVLSFVLGSAARVISTHIGRIGRSCGIGSFTLSFVFLGIATSMPEISVAVFSSLRGTPGLSLGNLLGANVVLLSLLTGLAAVIAGKLDAPAFRHDGILPLFLAVIGLPAVAVLDGRVTRAEGVIMILAHVLFLAYFARFNRGTDRSSSAACRPGADVAKALAALAVLLVASYFLVNSALALAQALGLAPIIIGLLMLSVGTNLPELTFVTTQAKERGAAIVLGDLFGSALTNTPTLGLLALLSPFTIDRPAKALAAAILLFVLLALFGTFMHTGRRLSRREGYALIAFYGLFLLTQLDIIAAR